MCLEKQAQCAQLLIFTISGTICTLILALGVGEGEVHQLIAWRLGTNVANVP
jgi:hypothetical protein